MTTTNNQKSIYHRLCASLSRWSEGPCKFRKQCDHFPLRSRPSKEFIYTSDKNRGKQGKAKTKVQGRLKGSTYFIIFSVFRQTKEAKQKLLNEQNVTKRSGKFKIYFS